MAAQSNDPEIERTPSEHQNNEAARRQDTKRMIAPLPAVEPSPAPTSPEQPRGAWVNSIDRPRNRFVLFAATGFLAVAALLIPRILSSLQYGLGSWLLLTLLATFLFPLGLLVAFGMGPWMRPTGPIDFISDYPAPRSPGSPLLFALLLASYCLVCLAYFSLPLIGSFPAPRRRTVFVAWYLIFVVMLVTNMAGCASILPPTGPK